MIKFRVDTRQLDSGTRDAHRESALQVDDRAEIPIAENSSEYRWVISSEHAISTVGQHVYKADLCLVRNMERRVRPLGHRVVSVQRCTVIVQSLRPSVIGEECKSIGDALVDLRRE